ncbi:MAG: hypothetical protein Q8K36_03870 [Alphaproteobacteria bacterium]|nr:hypothetical protein [Alphaproteobacteria bacterium]
MPFPYNNPLHNTSFSEPVPDLKDILFHSDMDSGTLTPTWMVKLDEVFKEMTSIEVDGGKEYNPCFGFKMFARRQISGHRLTQNYANARVHHSRIWFVVPLDNSTPTLFNFMHNGKIIDTTSIVRLIHIGGETYNQIMWQATFKESHLEHVEIIRDFVMFSLSVSTGEQKVFKYNYDGTKGGQAVSSFDYVTNTGAAE